MITGVDCTGVAVSFLCHDGDGNFLFHQRSQHTRDEQGKWDWGSGKLEFGETVPEALAREIKEEYGCDIVSVDEILPPTVWHSQTAGHDTHWVILNHVVRVNHSQVKNNEPRSISQVGWFKFNNLPQPLHRGVVKEIEQFKSVYEKYEK